MWRVQRTGLQQEQEKGQLRAEARRFGRGPAACHVLCHRRMGGCCCCPRPPDTSSAMVMASGLISRISWLASIR